jgi:hypothetical protein
MAASSQVIVTIGDAAPGGNGTIADFASFEAVKLNNAGRAVFYADLANTAGGATDNQAIYSSNGGPLAQIARAGQPAPAGGNYDADLSPFPIGYFINDSGQVAFVSKLTGTSSSTNAGVFRGDGVSTVQIARKNQVIPSGLAALFQFDDFAFLNNAGQVAFEATCITATTPFVGIFRGDGTTMQQIAQTGQTIPGGGGTFNDLGSRAINSVGQVAFAATATISASNRKGIFRGDGTTLVQIAREGQTAPGGNGTFTSINVTGAADLVPQFNDLGQVLFRADLSGSDFTGLFRGDGTSIAQIARRNQPTPGGNGVFSTFFSPLPDLNNTGQAIFVASLSGTTGGLNDDRALFIGNGISLTELAREGQASPDGGTFIDFQSPRLNDAGQGIFLAGTTSGTGAFYYDGLGGLSSAVHTGDALLGSTITSIGTLSELNSLRQFAYRFTLADGRSGIAITTVPEPALIGLLALSPVLLRRRRHNRLISNSR